MDRSGINKRLSTAAVLMLIVSMLLLAACGGKKQNTTEAIVRDGIWEEMDKLKGISPDDIDKIDYMFYTVAGGMGNTLEDKTEIKNVYDLLTAVSLGDPTEMAVEDDGLVVTVSAGDEKMSFSFEHDILVESNNDRYLATNMGPLKKYLQDLLPEE